MEKNLYVICLPFIVLFLTVLYFMFPLGYEPLLLWFCMFIFYFNFAGALAPVYMRNNIPLYMHGRFAFHLFYFLIFIYPYQVSLMGGVELEVENSIRGYSYYEYSNRAVLLSVLAISLLNLFYYLFSGRYKEIKGGRRGSSETESVIFLMLVVSSLLCLLFVVVNLYMNIAFIAGGEYRGSDFGGLYSNAMYNFARITSMWCAALFVYYLYIGGRFRRALVFSAPSFIWMLLILAIGDRNEFLLIAMIYIIGYAALIRPIRFGYVLCIILAALILYEGLGISRKAVDISLLDAVNETLFGGWEESTYGVDLFKNTTVITRAVFAHVPADYPYENGKSIFSSAAGLIPFLGGAVRGLIGNEGNIMTDALLGANASWGVGSSLIVGAYKNFGFLGVFLYMPVIGFLIAKIETTMRNDFLSVRAVATCLIATSLIAQLPRYDIYALFRPVAWTFVYFSLLMIFSRILARRP